MKREVSGFTLIEVLVALAVLAVSLGALISAVSSQTRNAEYLTERTLAQWVAANAVAEIRIEQGWPVPGMQRGGEAMAGQNWRWEAVTVATEDTDLRRLEVAVHPVDGDREGAIVTLVAYLGRPMVKANP